MALMIAFAALLVVVGSLVASWFKKVYFWQNDSGEHIKGTLPRLFTTPLISLRDNRLTDLGLYLLRFVPMPKLMITDALIAAKFMAKQYTYSRLNDFRLGYIFENLFGQAVGSASGPRHKLLRSIFDKGYSTESVAENLGIMEEECEKFLKETVDKKQGVITMDDILHVTFRVLVKFTFGSSLPERDFQELSEIRDLSGTLIADTFTNALIKMPCYRYLPTGTNRRLAEYKRRWKAFVDRYVEKMNYDRSMDVESAIYKVCQAMNASQERLTEEEVMQTLEESSLANADVTSGAISWLVFHAALYTDLQKELATEIERVLSETSGPLDMSVLSKMTFLGKFIKESARKRPVLSVTTPEYLKCPMTIGGFHAPANIEVAVDVNAVNNDTKVWQDPLLFNPRRFDNETANMRKCLFRFGLGTRRCMGFRLADAFMKVLIVTMLHSYDLVNETSVVADDHSVPVNELGIFSMPKVKFRIQKRSV